MKRNDLVEVIQLEKGATYEQKLLIMGYIQGLNANMIMTSNELEEQKQKTTA
jgi:Fe2+ transport system protein FeoA